MYTCAVFAIKLTQVCSYTHQKFHLGVGRSRNAAIHPTVCSVSDSIPFARWQRACVAASNALDKGQRGRLFLRLNAIREGGGAARYTVFMSV